MKMKTVMKKIVNRLIAVFVWLFQPKSKNSAQIKIKSPPQQKVSAKIKHDDAIHWCHNSERHGQPVPREFFTRGYTESGKQFSVFQCSDSRCREFVAAVINNGNPEASWILFRGNNYRPRPERRPTSATPGKSLPPHRNPKPDWSPGEPVTDSFNAPAHCTATCQRGPRRFARATAAAMLLALSIGSASAASDLLFSGAITVSTTSVTSGNTITFTATIRNSGSTTAAASTMRLQVKNSTLTATIVDQDISIPAIAAGGSTTQNYTVTIPAGTAPASYNGYFTLDRYNTAGQGSNTGNDYGTSPAFTVTSPASPPAVSATLSTVTASPNTMPANGASAITIVVVLKDSNGNPVSGKTVNVYAGTLPLMISGATGQTDANGRMTATATATTPCAGSIWAIDRTDVLLLNQEAPVQFTSVFISPNSDLSQAITALYQNSANSLWSSATPSISSIGAKAGASGDEFRVNFTEDKASGVLDAVLGIATLGTSAGESIEFADLLALPGLEETGTGPLIKNSPLAAALLDTEMIQNHVSARVLKSGLLQIAAVAKNESVGKVSDLALQSALQYIAAQPKGLSIIANNNSVNCLTYGEALQQQSQGLITIGIPPLSTAAQSAWANDLQLRCGVGTAFIGILSHENDFVNQFSAARQQASEDALKLLLAKFAIEASATVFFDGPGALVTGGIFTIAGENTTLRNMNSDQNGYNTAFSIIGGCVQYAGQTYLNTASAYTEIVQGRAANPVTAQVAAMADWEDGYATWSPLQSESKFSVTKAYSTIDIQNTSVGAATFEVVVLSGYASSAYGENIPNMSQVSIKAVNIPAGTDMQVPVVYYDGQNGGKPDSATLMTVYILANNVSGTFLVAAFSHSWSPSTTSASASNLAMVKSGSIQPTPFGATPNSTNSITDVENPVTSYITQNPTNQDYTAEIFVVNPFNHDYAAIVTQELPAGVAVLASDGNAHAGTIVWTNTIVAGGLAKDTFSFSLSVLPGVSTNLPAPVVIFADQTNNESSILSSVLPSFDGAFPVEVNGLVPSGSVGSDAPMPVGVTNLTGTAQTGAITISVVNHAGIEVTNYSETFLLAGSSGTILDFWLPDSLPPDSYMVSASLTVNGGSSQVLAGVYVVPVAPITLGFNSMPPLTTNGFSMKLAGPVGNYLIVWTTNLSNLVGWQPLMYLSVTNSPFSFTDARATNYDSGFYRAVAQ